MIWTETVPQSEVQEGGALDSSTRASVSDEVCASQHDLRQDSSTKQGHNFDDEEADFDDQALLEKEQKEPWQKALKPEDIWQVAGAN